jgi:putative ABC transport system permease protein
MPLWAPSQPGLQIEGRASRSRAERLRTVVNTVDRGYFDTAGIPLIDGRAFNDADRDTTLPVAIVNQKLANDYFPSGALGHRLQIPGEKISRTIVGVARTANYSSWGEAPQSCVYVPLAQQPSGSMALYVRTRGDPRQLLAAAEREIHGIAPSVLLFGVRSGREIIEGGLFQARMGVGLLTIFGLLALGLASIGLYGVVAYSVNQRRREIGLRMALGASPAAVLRMILTQGMSLVGAGLVFGFVAAIGAGRLVSRLLYGISPMDPLSLASAALALAGIALLACYLPARSATRIDPLTTLRDA